jgi:protein-S-isoprenylcysteine O-methyltransferase Ste14
MSFWFVVATIGLLIVVPLHFLSVEHDKLDKRFGKESGYRVGAALGMISGWGFFLFLILLWISPQDSFLIQIWDIHLVVGAGFLSLSIPISHFVLSIAFFLPGAYLGIKGVSEMGLKAAETHRADRVISTGVYARVRHPQYLGAILSHLGGSFLFSGYHSLLITPLVIAINYVLCWKEEKELIREFGGVYREYQEKVPMLFPRRRIRREANRL